MDAGDDVAKIAENMFTKILNDSRSKVLESLKNISNYLPVNVEYTVTVAKNCNIVKYNKPFYFKIPLIIAGAFIVIGIIFGFFGKLGENHRYSRYLEEVLACQSCSSFVENRTCTLTLRNRVSVYTNNSFWEKFVGA